MARVVVSAIRMIPFMVPIANKRPSFRNDAEIANCPLVGTFRSGSIVVVIIVVLVLVVCENKARCILDCGVVPYNGTRGPQIPTINVCFTLEVVLVVDVVTTGLVSSSLSLSAVDMTCSFGAVAVVPIIIWWTIDAVPTCNVT